MVRERVRIRFSKRGDLRLIGHRDLMRCLERLLRRARLPLGMSEGFHPKPRMTFPLALALGIESVDEVAEFELCEHCDADDVLARLRAATVPGLEFASAEILPEGTKKAEVHHVTYEVPVPAEQSEGLSNRIDGLMAQTSYPIERPKQKKPLDLRSQLEKLTLREGRLAMHLRIDRGAKASPRDVLTALNLADLEEAGVHLTRTAVEVQS